MTNTLREKDKGCSPNGGRYATHNHGEAGVELDISAPGPENGQHFINGVPVELKVDRDLAPEIESDIREMLPAGFEAEFIRHDSGLKLTVRSPGGHEQSFNFTRYHAGYQNANLDGLNEWIGDQPTLKEVQSPDLMSVEQLAEYYDWPLETAVAYRKAKNSGTTAEELAILAGDDSVAVRGMVADNQNTDLATLVNLGAGIGPNTGSYFPMAVRRAAQNPDCPPAALKRWAKIYYESIRAVIAANPNTPVKTFRTLTARAIKNHDVATLLALAKNPSTPNYVIQRLANGSGSESDTAAHSRL